MRKLVIWILLVFLGLTATAQNISVKSFRALPMDMSASSKEGKRIDQNGQVAALIKVMTTEKDFVFEGGTLGIVDTQQRVGEIWVWVPRGLRKITILHQQLGGLRDYFFPVEIEAERTYEMVLVTGTVETIVKEKVTKQFLAFQITPPNATLEVNDQIWDLSPDGTAQKFVDFGTYTYRVQAPNYHPDAGKVVVNDPDNTQKAIVTLQPNFGWIEVAGTGNLQGASVYIDNVFLGKAPCKSEILKSGNHSVRITKDMYQPYNGTVVVNDNETTTVAPSLTADFAEVTLKVDADAEIWVNNELKGVGQWTGPLGNGTYKVECKMVNHENSLSTQEITSDMAGQTITLPAPRPIYGSLTVESTPGFAQFYLDGKAMGETPKFIKELLIGQHVIKLTKEGYADYTETVTVTKGENKQVNATLNNGTEIRFTCNVPDATFEIDGQRMTSANGTYRLTFGQHDLRATAPEHHDYTAVINVSENSRSHSITLDRIIPEGAIAGVFSVSDNKKVVFSKGNLQYQASTKTWRFAEHQWDRIGVDNIKVSPTYSGWIDLFGWGTSGYNGKNPYMTSENSKDYGDGKNKFYGDRKNKSKNDINITGTNYDWGVYNAISNGGNKAGIWQTMTADEWVHLLDKRNTVSGIRYAVACVNSIKGVILLPDNWSTSYYELKLTNKFEGSNTAANEISVSDWMSKFEANGAVFLPTTSDRVEQLLDYHGQYWTITGQMLFFNLDYGHYTQGFVDWVGGIYNGCSVRLVHPVQ